MSTHNSTHDPPTNTNTNSLTQVTISSITSNPNTSTSTNTNTMSEPSSVSLPLPLPLPTSLVPPPPPPPPPPPTTTTTNEPPPPPPPPPTTTTTTVPPPPPTSSSSSTIAPPPPTTVVTPPTDDPTTPTPTSTSSSSRPPPPPITTRTLTQVTSLIRVTSTAFSTSQVIVTVDGGRTSASQILIATQVIQTIPTMVYVDDSGNVVEGTNPNSTNSASPTKPSSTVVAMAIILPVALVAVLLAAIIVRRRRHHTSRRLSFGMPLFRPSASGPGAGTSGVTSGTAYDPLRPTLANHAPTAAPQPPPMVHVPGDASLIPLIQHTQKAMLPPGTPSSPPLPPDAMLLPPLTDPNASPYTDNPYADPPLRTAGGPPPESYPAALFAPASPPPPAAAPLGTYGEPYADMFQSPPMHPTTPLPLPPTSPMPRIDVGPQDTPARPHVSRPIVGLATRPEVTSVVVRTAPQPAQVPAPQESPVSAAGMHARWQADDGLDDGVAFGTAAVDETRDTSDLYLPESGSTLGTRSSDGRND